MSSATLNEAKPNKPSSTSSVEKSSDIDGERQVYQVDPDEDADISDRKLGW